MKQKTKDLIWMINQSIDKTGVAKISKNYLINLYYPNSKNRNTMAFQRRLNKIIMRLVNRNNFNIDKTEHSIEFKRR